jgi:hypothetical protein
MSSFDDRERAEGARYAHDQETQFKIGVRRNKLLGLWAADLLGLSGGDADAYAKTVVMSDLEEAGDDDVIRKVLGDLKAKQVNRNEAEIRLKMAELLPVARDQVMKDIKS